VCVPQTIKIYLFACVCVCVGMSVFGKQWKLFQFNCDYEYIAHHTTISPIYTRVFTVN